MLVLDQGCLEKKDYFSPFALTEQLIAEAFDTKETILHFWQLDHAVILGMKDTRLSHLETGLTYLKDQGYQPIVRNSGGLGVVADTGILNISLILPQPPEGKFAIDIGYEKMTAWMQQTFATIGEIVPGEVVHSYCPGTFDLSISGQKIAGISQRRNQQGMAVMLYLSVNEPQFSRGELMEQFYQLSLDPLSDSGYPEIFPNSMTSLEKLIGKEVAIEQVKQQLLTAFQHSYRTYPNPEKLYEQRDYKTRLFNMKKRNEGIL